MKKNYPMRVGALLLALTLVTSCFVGGTFAKYVTSGEGTDTARVAKFGVTVTGEGTTFAKAYDADDKDYTVPADSSSTSSTTGAGVTVQSSGEDNVVAPGTKGDMAAFTITGTPEVAVRVSYAAEFKLSGDWTIKDGTTTQEDDGEDSTGGTFYCPLIITINPTKDTTTTDSQPEAEAEGGEDPQAEPEPQKFCGLNYDSAEKFEKAVNDAIAAYSKVYKPNTDLAQQTADGLAISWEWPFEGKEEDNEESSAVVQDGDSTPDETQVQTNEKDTYLGNVAATTGGTENQVSLTVTATVTQID